MLIYRITVIEGLDINQYIWSEEVCIFHFGQNWNKARANRLRGYVVEQKGLV